MRCRHGSAYFYPRPPRGGRLFTVAVAAGRDLFLSTPSARRATFSARFFLCLLGYFYPRPPRGGRQAAHVERGQCKKFLSTPSARRATARGSAASAVCTISIHALREEGDPTTSYMFSCLQVISIHALREEGDALHIEHYPVKWNFYPRPPRGGRPY